MMHPEGDSIAYDTPTTYTAPGDPATVQYPGSASPDVTYAYNNGGAMTGMSLDGQPVLSNGGYLPSGQLWFYQLGNSPGLDPKS